MRNSVAIENSEWLKIFFSKPNSINWHDVIEDRIPVEFAAHINPWLAFLDSPSIKLPMILPLYLDNTQVTWYGFVEDDRQFSQFLDEVHSFIGRSYSDFSGAKLDPEHACAFELDLVRKFSGHVLKFSPLRPEDTNEIARILLDYNHLLKNRPPILDRSTRPFGKIRRDFDLALVAGNETSAELCLTELIDTGRVDAEQHKCLQIRMLAGLGRDEEIARDRVLVSSLADIKIPAQILVDIINALYVTYILPIESSSTEAVVDTFRARIPKSFESLFQKRRGISSPNVLKAFMLYELGKNEPSYSRCESIVSSLDSSVEDYNILERWFNTLQKPLEEGLPELSISELAKQAIVDEEYSEAVNLAIQLIPDQWAYTVILRCALEVDSHDVYVKVSELMRVAPSSVLTSFAKKDRTRFEEILVKVAEPENVFEKTWLGWAKSVRQGQANIPIVDLQEYAATWDVDDYVTSTEKCEEFSDLIGNSTGDAEEIFRQAFPQIAEFFLDRPSKPSRPLISIYKILIKTLAWSDVLSSDELEISASLLSAALQVGLSRSEYEEFLEDFHEIVVANKSISHLDWVLNSSEALALLPAQDGGAARLRIFVEAVSIVQMSPHRLTSLQREILEFLAKDYNCLDLIEALPDQVVAGNNVASGVADYSGFIAIYTLMEGAGKRAKELISKHVPRARIETNGDSVATEKLTSLAKNSDIFVFAWKASKHQAFFCIKNARHGREILLPLGKGTASIVSIIISKIESGI